MKGGLRFWIILISILFTACQRNGKPETQISEEIDCETRKIEIEQLFQVKEYTKTIQLYKSYQPCIKGLEEYYFKLAMLYKKNNEIDLYLETRSKFILELEKNTSLTKNDLVLSKAFLYLYSNEKEKFISELSQVDTVSLSNENRDTFEYLKLYENVGEYISMSTVLEFSFLSRIHLIIKSQVQ